MAEDAIVGDEIIDVADELVIGDDGQARISGARRGKYREKAALSVALIIIDDVVGGAVLFRSGQCRAAKDAVDASFSVARAAATGKLGKGARVIGFVDDADVEVASCIDPPPCFSSELPSVLQCRQLLYIVDLQSQERFPRVEWREVLRQWQRHHKPSPQVVCDLTFDVETWASIVFCVATTHL